jgi:DNA-binding GntR family transcriptional regulator
MITQLDDESGVARYRQLAAILEDGIRAGTWKPRQRVPSRVELSQRYGVDVGTVSHAHAYLVSRGLVVRRPGRGIFVLPAERWQAS